MRPALALAAVLAFLAAGPLLAQQTGPDNAALDAQYKAAQLDVQLANLRLALVQVQVKIKSGQLAQAKQDLANVQEMLRALTGQTDLTAYQQVAAKLTRDLSNAEIDQRRVEVARQYGQAPIPEEAFKQGYGDPKTVDPRQPGLDGQVDQAVEQAKLGEQSGMMTNPPGSRVEMTTDPAVVRQRTLDNQTLWDQGRYAPAKELIDTGKLLELERERIVYHSVVERLADGSHGDEFVHIREALVVPPTVVSYPPDWRQIEAQRAQYASGKIFETAPFRDADGKTKTVAVYDVSDLLFVPIFPGPAEYNLNRPINPLRFWTNQDRVRDLYLHPPYSWFGPGYNDAVYGGPIFAPPQAAEAGAAPNAGAVAGDRYGIGGYNGYRVTDIIPSVHYFPYEADPIYQYRLAAKRAQLLNAVSRMLETVKD